MMKPIMSEQIVKAYMSETYPHFVCLLCACVLLCVLVMCLVVFLSRVNFFLLTI